MKKLLITLFLIFCFNSNLLNAQSATIDKMNHVIDSIRLAYENRSGLMIPSLSILIHTPTEEYFATSSRQNEPPVTKDTYFRFASNTKNFTSASILNMQEDGWLNIKDKITDFIPGSAMTYVPEDELYNIPYKSQITIEQLLNHTAGVYDIDNDTVPGFNNHSYTDYMTFQNRNFQFELDQLVGQVSLNQLSFFPPGTSYHYSNTGYSILSKIIERIYSLKTGSPKLYSDYIYDKITGPNAPVPLDVHFPWNASDTKLKEPYAVGILYAQDSTNFFTDVNVSAHVGEGNGYATFATLDKYVRTMMRGENVLTKSSIQLMQNTTSEYEKTYGLGCLHIEHLGYGHNGCIKGYLSYMLYDPVDDVSVIIMTPVNDYTKPDEGGIIMGIKTLVNAGFAARTILGLPSSPLIPY